MSWGMSWGMPCRMNDYTLRETLPEKLLHKQRAVHTNAPAGKHAQNTNRDARASRATHDKRAIPMGNTIPIGQRSDGT